MNTILIENNQYKYTFKNKKILNYINAKQNKYKLIFNKTLKIIKNKPKGIIELKFLYFINGEHSAFKNKNEPFILPSARVIANIIGCSNAYVLKLLKKYKNLFFNWCNSKWKWRYKKETYCINPNFILDYKKLDIYFFRTKWYKFNILKKRASLEEINELFKNLFD